MPFRFLLFRLPAFGFASIEDGQTDRERERRRRRRKKFFKDEEKEEKRKTQSRKGRLFEGSRSSGTKGADAEEIVKFGRLDVVKTLEMHA